MLIILESHFDSFRMCRNPSLPGFLIRFARGAGASTGAALIEWHGGLTGWWLADNFARVVCSALDIVLVKEVLSQRQAALSAREESVANSEVSQRKGGTKSMLVAVGCARVSCWLLALLALCNLWNEKSSGMSELSILICRFRCVYRAFFADPMQIEHSCHNLQKSTISITISMQSNLTAHWHLQFVSGLFYICELYIFADATTCLYFCRSRVMHFVRQFLVKTWGCVFWIVNLSVALLCSKQEMFSQRQAAVSACEKSMVKLQVRKVTRGTEWWSGNKSADLNCFSKLQSFGYTSSSNF